ncbi:hypothetical protein P4O66_005173 [Electrophorus voltai]|uniref:Uncharacterized protein n=1 Tax=Electrophorus voltai TaxID=2609070 RepID=A0AAD8ZWS3_9TELE|nr:hypothetical protein P4O66_005173 [Electrophorus voltai]
MDTPENPQKKAKNAGRKKKQPVHSGDIVFTKNGAIHTIPALSKLLKSATEPVIGLQYIWEYRSPSKSVPPHYQCKLCKVQLLQHEMAAHIIGWKHCFRYLKRSNPEKMAEEEPEVAKNPVTRRAIKTAAMEVEKAEGRGQVKVVIKEPSDVPAFQNMKTAHPTVGGPGGAGILGPAPRGLHPGVPFGGFPDLSFPGDFPPRGGLLPDFPPMHSVLSDGPMRRGHSDMGPLPSPGRYGNSLTGPNRALGNPESMQRFPSSGSVRMGLDGFGMGPRSDGAGRPYPNDPPMNANGSRKTSEGNSTLTTLLRYLDTFRIENEDDAQVVLKITQKLTDVLMEYRLRSISSVPSMDSSSLSSMSYSSRLPPSSNDRLPSSMTGPSRFYN